jgi:hypothetical protein
MIVLGVPGLPSPDFISLVEKFRLLMIVIENLKCGVTGVVGHSKCVTRKRIRTICFEGRKRFYVTILF